MIRNVIFDMGQVLTEDEALARYNLQPEECVFIDDMKKRGV